MTMRTRVAITTTTTGTRTDNVQACLGKLAPA